MEGRCKGAEFLYVMKLNCYQFGIDHCNCRMNYVTPHEENTYSRYTKENENRVTAQHRRKPVTYRGRK